jgi:transposase
LLISKKEKEKMVIKLASEGKTTREIAKAVHISLKDIGKIIRKVTGDADESPAAEKEMEEEQKKQNRMKSLSHYAQAFQMFKDGKSLVDVAIEIDQESIIVLNYYKDYLRLTRMKDLVILYDEHTTRKLNVYIDP